MENNADCLELTLWKPKRKFYFLAILQYVIYFGMAIVFCWFCWFVLLKESLWYLILALGLSIFYTLEIYEALNFKSMFLTNKGLLLKTRFNGNTFYPYGCFVISYSITVGLRFSESIKICNLKYQERSFIFPCGMDSLGSFENNLEFKDICTYHTKQALEAMDVKDIANLYLLYKKYVFDKERNYNVFIIDFSPYIQVLKEFFCKEIQTTLQTMGIVEIVKTYRFYERMFKNTGNLKYNTEYFSPYIQEIYFYLKDKK